MKLKAVKTLVQTQFRMVMHMISVAIILTLSRRKHLKMGFQLIIEKFKIHARKYPGTSSRYISIFFNKIDMIKWRD